MDCLLVHNFTGVSGVRAVASKLSLLLPTAIAFPTETTAVVVVVIVENSIERTRGWTNFL